MILHGFQGMDCREISCSEYKHGIKKAESCVKLVNNFCPHGEGFFAQTLKHHVDKYGVPREIKHFRSSKHVNNPIYPQIHRPNKNNKKKIYIYYYVP